MTSVPPAATAATAATAANTASTPAAPASAQAPQKEVLFPEMDKDSAKPGEPSKKKRKLELRLDRDPSLKKILRSVVGTRAERFQDGLVSEETIEALKALWMRLDFVKNGVLKQIEFQSVRGIDPLWEQLLEACDVDGDGNITPTEFVAGFVFEALDKPMTVQMPPGATVIGFDVMKSLRGMLDMHIMNQVDIFKKVMGWQ